MSCAKSIKTVRKVDKPRPLRSTSKSSLGGCDPVPAKKQISDIVKEIEALNINLSNCNFDENSAADIEQLCKLLKDHGEALDISLKSFLDHCFITIRNSSREDRLDMISRLKLLEIIEMRAMRWHKNENISSSYRKKIAELEGIEKGLALSQSFSALSMQSTPLQQSSASISIPLAAGEILRSSGKFPKPMKLAGKNYFKDEVVIRNSDSGKVSPGVRDRLVQITGPNEEAIGYAKNLVEDTIRRNASPIRDKINDSLNMNNSVQMTSSFSSENLSFGPPRGLSHSLSMTDASTMDYSFRLEVGNDSLSVSGTNLELLKLAQSVLQSVFMVQSQKDHFILPPVSQSALDNFQIQGRTMKTSLQRSSSCISSGGESRASVSPLDSFSEDEPYTEHDLKNSHSNDVFTVPLKPTHVDTVDNHELLLSASAAEETDIPSPRMTYSKKLLFSFSKSPLCQVKPYISADVLAICPMIVKGNHPIRSKDSTPE